jgi:hypothetical protein
MYCLLVSPKCAYLIPFDTFDKEITILKPIQILEWHVPHNHFIR